MEANKTNSNWKGATIIVIISVIVALFFAEFIVRAKNADMKNYDIEMWRYAKELKTPSTNPILSFEHKINSSAILQSTQIRINEWGMRGGPIPNSAQDQRRILFLGASITLGWGVNEEETVTSLIEKGLRQTGESVTVMNAGIGNYNAERYVELFSRKLYKLKPTDIVVHYFLRDAELLESGGGNWFLKNSELAMMLWIASNHARARLGEKSLEDHYRAAYQPEAAGYKKMKSSLSKLAEYAKRNNVRIYLAIVPDVHDLENYQLGFAHQMVAHEAATLGYKVVDLLPSFGNLKPKDVWAMPGDPHPNALGHKLMAETLLPVLALTSK